MPSGAKKRKAAKRKKEIQSDNHINPPLHSLEEDDDVKNRIQEDRDSDVSSPTSQDHRGSRQNVVSGSEGEEIGDKESKNYVGIEGDEQSSIRVEGGSKPDDEPHGIEINDSSDSTSREPIEEKIKCVSEKNQVVATLGDEVDRSMASTEEADKGNEKTSDSCESDEALVVSYDATKAGDDDYVLLSERDYAGTQTHTAPPHPAGTTSWKGCCGLFELFSGGSSR